jgi:hypothetical protein
MSELMMKDKGVRPIHLVLAKLIVIGGSGRGNLGLKAGWLGVNCPSGERLGTYHMIQEHIHGSGSSQDLRVQRPAVFDVKVKLRF